MSIRVNFNGASIAKPGAYSQTRVNLSGGFPLSATGVIAIVGEAPGSYEDAQLKPFVGPAGTVLENCLHAAGIIRSDCYLTNVVKVRPKNNIIDPYFSGTKGTFTAEGMEWVNFLREELDRSLRDDRLTPDPKSFNG